MVIYSLPEHECQTSSRLRSMRGSNSFRCTQTHIISFSCTQTSRISSIHINTILLVLPQCQAADLTNRFETLPAQMTPWYVRQLQLAAICRKLPWHPSLVGIRFRIT